MIIIIIEEIYSPKHIQRIQEVQNEHTHSFYTQVYQIL